MIDFNLGTVNFYINGVDQGVAKQDDRIKEGEFVLIGNMSRDINKNESYSLTIDNPL